MDDFESDPPETLQEIVPRLASLLGISALSGSPVLASPAGFGPGAAGAMSTVPPQLTFAGNTISLSLEFEESAFATLPLDLELGGALGNLVDLRSDGTATANALAAYSIGLDFDFSNPQSPAFYLRDDSGFDLDLKVLGEDLAFQAGVLGLGVRVGKQSDPGGFWIHDGNQVAPGFASWSLGLAPNPGAGDRYALSQAASAVTSQLTGSAGADLPIFFPDENTYLDPAVPSLTLSVPDLADPLNMS